jgi:hypothetical protein
MTDDRYDDGLVHSHAWVTEPLAHVQTQQQQQQQAQPAPGQPNGTTPSFDDGLVHSHNWASGEYAAPAAAK